MKKLLVMLMVTCMMMVCSVSFAADDHKALAKQMPVAEKIFDALDGEPVPAFAQVSAGFNANLKQKFDEKAFENLKKQVRTKFGNMKEAKFFAFQRFDQVDRVIYIASFSKEKIVNVVFAFDKQNKLVDFAFSPVKQPEVKK